LLKNVSGPPIAIYNDGRLDSTGDFMSASPTVLEINRALAERINQEARDNPHSPYAGKFVGLANGQVVATANDLDEAMRQLRSIEPDPQKSFCFEAGVDYGQVQYVWEMP
jgi:hypothetical protein